MLAVASEQVPLCKQRETSRSPALSEGSTMTTDLDRLRRAGGGVLKLLVDLIPVGMSEDADADDAAAVELCLIFADVADYSDFVADAGDDAAIDVLEVLDGLLDDTLVACHTARIVKRLGDGIMIVTEDPAEALDIAVALVDEFTVRTLEAGFPLRLRAGVHRGTVRRRSGDVFGYHVNLAARLAASARAGQTLVTAHSLAGVDIDALALEASAAGTLTAKGITRPVTTFAVERVADAECPGGDPTPPRGLRLPRVPRVPRMSGMPGIPRVPRRLDRRSSEAG
jgi:adenylate cyclase